MSHAEPVSRRLWSDWLFERVPLPPALFGALLAAALLGLLALLAVATGALDRLAAEGIAWWQDRDGRGRVLLALLAGTIPRRCATTSSARGGTSRRSPAANLWPGSAPAALRRATSGSPRAALAFGLSGFLLIPDRSPSPWIAIRDSTSRPTTGVSAQTWTWIVGVVRHVHGRHPHLSRVQRRAHVRAARARAARRRPARPRGAAAIRAPGAALGGSRRDLRDLLRAEPRRRGLPARERC